MTNKNLIIDGESYAVDNLSAEAKDQIINLRVTDAEIERLNAQIAIAKTARISYAKALAALLVKVNEADADRLN
jgi:hypothetical protein